MSILLRPLAAHLMSVFSVMSARLLRPLAAHLMSVLSVMSARLLRPLAARLLRPLAAHLMSVLSVMSTRQMFTIYGSRVSFVSNQPSLVHGYPTAVF